MTLRKIILHPADVLRRPAEPVVKITPEIRKILDDMLETMYAAPGIGLAAPQIGISQRMLVMNIDRDKKEGNPGTAYQLINPEIIGLSQEIAIYDEGCLSVPGVTAEIERPVAVTVKYLDVEGREQILEAEGLLATCVQHEIDHLDGVLFFDHLSRLKRQSVLRKYRKLRQQVETDKDHAL